MKIPDLMVYVADFALARGAASIKDLPGCWESDVDGHWWLAVNGHAETFKCSRGIDVPPYTIYVEFNGWPAGMIDAGGGEIAAGALANEDTLTKALRAAK